LSFPNEGIQVAIQTIFDRAENEHKLVFHKVTASQEAEKGTANGKLEEKASFLIKKGTEPDSVKCWLTD
jgi:hypothetical protein